MIIIGKARQEGKTSKLLEVFLSKSPGSYYFITYDFSNANHIKRLVPPQYKRYVYPKNSKIWKELLVSSPLIIDNADLMIEDIFHGYFSGFKIAVISFTTTDLIGQENFPYYNSDLPERVETLKSWHPEIVERKIPNPLSKLYLSEDFKREWIKEQK